MDLGAGRRGVDMGPSALRLARLAPALADLGHDVEDLGNVFVPIAETLLTESQGGLQFVDAIVDTCKRAFETVTALPTQSLPLCLGGDHSISMGTIAGAAASGRTGVIWVDAHADLNTPATSPSLNVHGMPMAHLLGHGDPRLTAVWGGGAAIRPEDVVFIGLRSLDEGERRLIRELNLKAFTMKDVDRLGLAEIADDTLEHLADVDRVHVSFDADVLDPSLAPGVGTPVEGGLGYREAHLLMELFADAGVVTSIDLVEVNPFLDVHNRTALTMVEMAASLLGKRIL